MHRLQEQLEQLRASPELEKLRDRVAKLEEAKAAAVREAMTANSALAGRNKEVHLLQSQLESAQHQATRVEQCVASCVVTSWRCVNS